MAEHYHIYLSTRRNGLRTGFFTSRKWRSESKAGAHKWAAKHQPDPTRRMVMRCPDDEGCPAREPVHISERRDDR